MTSATTSSGRVQLLLHELLARPERGDGHLDDEILRLLGDPLRSRTVELLSSEELCTSPRYEMEVGASVWCSLSASDGRVSLDATAADAALRRVLS